jgi:hypothetical protein
VGLLPLENLDGLGVAARKISRSPPHYPSQRLAPLQKTGVSGQKLRRESAFIAMVTISANVFI